jgi:ribosomal protein S18 acetylase RimI-like enzyme
MSYRLLDKLGGNDGRGCGPHRVQYDHDRTDKSPPAHPRRRSAVSRPAPGEPGDIFFGAFDGEELAGAICLRTQDGKKIRHAAELKALVVDPERQARGIGSALVAHLIEFSRSLGYLRQLTLTVIDGNTRAERLYDSFGFRQFGLEPDAFLHDGRYVAKQHRQLLLESPTS